MSTPKPAAKPHFLRIRDYILDGIKQRTFAPGAKIPPEVELARQFGVSRMTVNKAIRDLAEAGVLLRYAGDGTYVAERKAESPLLDVNNIAEEVALRGHAYRAQVLFARAEPASEEVALRLGMAAGAAVFHSLIVHHEDDSPIQIEDRYVNPQWAPDYLAQAFEQENPQRLPDAHLPAHRRGTHGRSGTARRRRTAAAGASRARALPARAAPHLVRQAPGELCPPAAPRQQVQAALADAGTQNVIVYTFKPHPATGHVLTWPVVFYGFFMKRHGCLAAARQ